MRLNGREPDNFDILHDVNTIVSSGMVIVYTNLLMLILCTTLFLLLFVSVTVSSSLPVKKKRSLNLLHFERKKNSPKLI